MVRVVIHTVAAVRFATEGLVATGRLSCSNGRAVCRFCRCLEFFGASLSSNVQGG